MKYFFLAAVLILSGCGNMENVNVEATKVNAEKACKKRGMDLENVKFTQVKQLVSEVRCIDPATREYQDLRIKNVLWNPSK